MLLNLNVLQVPVLLVYLSKKILTILTGALEMYLAIASELTILLAFVE